MITYFEEAAKFLEFCKLRNIKLATYGKNSPLKLKKTAHSHGGKDYYLLHVWNPSDAEVIAPPNWGFLGFQDFQSEFAVLASEVGAIQSQLADENSIVRRCSDFPIERAFVYVDVSEFSEFTDFQQVRVTSALAQLTDVKYWCGEDSKYALGQLESSICIGDGFIYVIKSALAATYFAAYLAHLIECLRDLKRLPVDFHFRCGAHFGPVHCFWDRDRKDWNFIGDGINGGQRVLSAVGKERDDLCFISGQMREKAGTEPCPDPQRNLKNDLHEMLDNRGRHEDKHKRKWRVYEVVHSRWVFREALRIHLLTAREDMQIN